MICGAGSFSHMDDNEVDGGVNSAPTTPKGSSRRKREKNPYATRGLDKFSTVLAELEARREKILAEAGRVQGEPMVRFMYNSTNDWIPVVVRLPENYSNEKNNNKKKNKKDHDVKHVTETKSQSSSPPPETVQQQGTNNDALKKTDVASVASPEKAKKKDYFNFGLQDYYGSLLKWRPTYYWPTAMVLILLCLLMFGRVFAICCTSIWWYLVPTVQEWNTGGVNGKRSAKKKEHKKRVAVLPPSSPKGHHHHLHYGNVKKS